MMLPLKKERENAADAYSGKYKFRKIQIHLIIIA